MSGQLSRESIRSSSESGVLNDAYSLVRLMREMGQDENFSPAVITRRDRINAVAGLIAREKELELAFALGAKRGRAGFWAYPNKHGQGLRSTSRAHFFVVIPTDRVPTWAQTRGGPRMFDVCIESACSNFCFGRYTPLRAILDGADRKDWPASEAEVISDRTETYAAKKLRAMRSVYFASTQDFYSGGKSPCSTCARIVEIAQA
jgi:hypothetical protein